MSAADPGTPTPPAASRPGRPRTLRVAVVFGTRPEAVKMVPVVQELRRHPAMEPVVVVTAQHREMLDQVLDHFGVRPDYDLNLMRDRQSLTDLTVRALAELTALLADLRPDLVLVHGDTTTTLAAALAAYYARLPLGHVEAGLRTYDKYAPYPEEINRRLTDALADLHFAPTALNRDNLLAERVPERGIFVTGNTVIDALLRALRDDYRFADPRVQALAAGSGGMRVALVEVHRRENWGEPMRGIGAALRRALERHPRLLLVVSLHFNPEVREALVPALSGHPRAVLLDPPSYPEWVHLMRLCDFLVTDSGGLQEEAPALGKPVLLLRETTERPEAVAAGTVWRVGVDPDAIVHAITTLLEDPRRYAAMATARNPYGDGRAAERVVAAVAWWFGLAERRPADWKP